MVFTLVALVQVSWGADPWVTEHLLGVAERLRAETPAALPPPQRARRLELLDRLEDYALAGEYPEHTHPPRSDGPRARSPRMFAAPDGELRRPLFVDDDGTHCAVGYLMALDAAELVREVVAEANDAYVAEMHVDGLAAWAEQAGFTVDELGWIQPTYEFVMPTCDQVTPTPALWSNPSPCDGPDAGFNGASYRTIGCQDCCGPFLLHLAVVSNGTLDASNVTVEVREHVGEDPVGPLVLEQSGFAVAAGASVILGPFELPFPDDGYSVTVRAESDCNSANDTTHAYDEGSWLPPVCDTSVPCSEDTSTVDTSTMDTATLETADTATPAPDPPSTPTATEGGSEKRAPQARSPGGCATVPAGSLGSVLIALLVTGRRRLGRR